MRMSTNDSAADKIAGVIVAGKGTQKDVTYDAAGGAMARSGSTDAMSGGTTTTTV